MPGKASSQMEGKKEGILPKSPPQRHVSEIVEVFKELDRRISGSNDTISADVKETAGMTSDNYFG